MPNSSTFLSDDDGQPYQFMVYLPFGETMAEQTVTGWATPYMFNGKELDDNTGLYYYGARFYDPRISVWHGVDPLAGKYPGWTPYNYTFNNPINLIDLFGLSPQGPGDPPKVLDDGSLLLDLGAEIIACNDQLSMCQNEWKPLQSNQTSNMESLVREGNTVATIIGTTYTAANILTSANDITKAIESKRGFLFDVSKANGTITLTGKESHNQISKMLTSIGGENITLSKVSSAMNTSGQVLFFVGAGFSVVEGVYNFENGKYYDVVGNVADIGMGAVGAYGGLFGGGFSVLYFGSRLYYNNFGGKERSERMREEILIKIKNGTLRHPKLSSGLAPH